MRYFKKLIGENIYLSPMNPKDAEIYTKWINDLNVSVPLGSTSNIFSLDIERETLERLAKEKSNFAVVKLKNDNVIGNCSLFDIDLIHRRGELGIFIGEKDNWGRGYGTEAMRLLLEFGFKILNLHNVMLKVFSFNERAIKAYKKVGFEEIGRRTEAYRINDIWYDELYFQILAQDLRSDYLDNLLPD